ncbi:MULTISPECIES: MucBP domain-containing protein [unclassified Granulicatella]|uniref:MucBP domain-containing protein n=1 Tax=unclassified Granulicatella TaxID=2630493 RepID=UPI0010745959|nr:MULTISPECIES: MucBP domain-containing protein [unclassified Granulicatella]MBF0780787.1 MucBP domain-containing protein [Granulicatella sp. 19428wC4_WM01]TFU93832.1 hypothetical protein E4T68_06715 [Granulicatella sp. WM01]
MKNIKILIITMLMMFLPNSIIFAEEISTQMQNNVENAETSTKDMTTESSDVIIGEESLNLGELKKEDNKEISKNPTITQYIVHGELDSTKTGVDFYKNVSISLVGDNLTDRHFLTKEGLHWSEKTTVELITGKEIGILNDSNTFGVQNTPNVEIRAYSNNKGDSGRITFVGKTKSNEDLDLIWTVTDSDKEEWATNSGYANDNRIKGLGFTGEQYIPESTGNSIVVLYNNASNLGIHYKIVKHGTMEEMPVVLSFISTDIDAAQGVQTDLANITEIIPKESNLVKKDGIIYDATSGVVGLNGTKDLPKGGYLGAGFLSSFDYIFYSPAPERVHNSYHYPIAVRYDIFGSSLQANLLTRLKNHITVNYFDEDGKIIKASEQFTGYQDEKYFIQSLVIPKYKLVNIKKDEFNFNYPKIDFIYRPIYTINLKFIDDSGKEVSASKQYSAEKGYKLSYTAPTITGYDLPNKLETTVDNDINYTFVYKKVENISVQLERVEKIEQEVKTNVVDKSPLNQENERIDFKKVETATWGVSYLPSRPETVVTSPSVTNYTTPIVRQPNEITNRTVISQQGVTIPPTTLKQLDPFLINTGMTKEEKEIFLRYIKEVAKRSRDKHGDDSNKINHDIANAIAYQVYHNDFLQKNTNDFGEKPKELSDMMEDLFKEIHRDSRYIIDFPHLAAPLATAEKSTWWKELGKTIASLSPLNLLGESPKDIMFMNNSMTGDLLTNIDDKDKRTNIDAYIFRYHPDFKDLSLDERIEKYYSLDNLNIKRAEYYKQALELRGGGNSSSDYSNFINWGSAISLAGLGLVGLTLFRKFKREWEEFNKEELAYLYKKVWKPMVNGANELLTNPLGFVGNRVLGSISNFVANTLVTGGLTLKVVGNKVINGLVKPVYKHVVKPVVKFVNESVVKPVYNNIIKPAGKLVNNYVVKPFVKYVVKPVYNNIIKPAGKLVNNYVVKPFVKYVVKPVYNNIIKPAGKLVNNYIVKPFIKYVACPINNYVVKPIVNHVVKPVYNNIIKPMVKPIYNKVIKPVGNFINKNILQPIGNFFKGIFK